MPKLDRGDASVHFEVTGRGPPLLMLAGFMSDHASWTPILERLNGDFTCICIDNRTTGQTTPWDAAVSVDLMCQDGLALMDHLGHARFHVLGHSMGGIIALQMAQRAPDRLASAHVAASAPIRLPRNTALFETLIAIRRSDAPADTWLRALFPWLFNPLVYQDAAALDAAITQSLGYPHAQSADAMEHQLNALRDFDGTDLATPTCATQVLVGALDLIVPPDHALAVLGHLPHHIIEGAGHSIHWDAPDAVSTHVRTFAARHPI